MRIQRATREYAAWLGAQTPLSAADLARKYAAMAEGKDKGLFTFFRATCYRWAQLWPKQCPALHQAPRVLAAGDLHVENFGIWHNAEERLIWGANDLDEADLLPYTADLVRLAASADLAIRAHDLDLRRRDACDKILSGYIAGLRSAGQPYVLDSAHDWLRRLTSGEPRKQAQWWSAILDLPPAAEPIPSSAATVLRGLLPQPGLPYRVVRREAGVGSLGRQRWTAIAHWQGAAIVREVKAAAPSCWRWAAQAPAGDALAGELLGRAVRSRDPWVRVEQGWITRRLAIDSRRLDLGTMLRRSAAALLEAMGRETANLHLGSPSAIAAVLRDLEQRPAHWLHDAAQAMIDALAEDWQEWRRDPIDAA